MKRILPILLSLLLLTGCGGNSADGYQQITQEEAKEMMDTQEVIILDVREQDEYDSGHIPGAVLLRHTFATHALTSGVDAKTLSGILGHTNASFTLDTYTHVTPDMQQEASHIVGGFLEDLLGKDLKPWQRDRPEGGARHG